MLQFESQDIYFIAEVTKNESEWLESMVTQFFLTDKFFQKIKLNSD